MKSLGATASHAAGAELCVSAAEEGAPHPDRSLRSTVRRSLQRAIVARWVRRLRIAEAIVAWASLEADILFAIGEIVRCVASHYSLQC